MLAFSLLIVPIFVMALAFLGLLYAGFAAGDAGDHQQLGLGALAICIVLMLAQAGLWAAWGLHLAGVIA